MGLRSLRQEFGVAIAAGESAIRINTDEINDALKTLTDVCRKHGWELRVWDATVGTVYYHGEEQPKDEKSLGKKDPFADQMNNQGAPVALTELLGFLNEPARPDQASQGDVIPVILAIKNFHLIFGGGMREHVSSAIQHIIGDKVNDHPNFAELNIKRYQPFDIDEECNTGKHIVGLMPAQDDLPGEIAPLFRVIDHELPNEEELGQIVGGLVVNTDEDDEDGQKLSAEDHKKVCRFALGLTRLQAEGVFSASIVQHGRIDPEYVWREKSKILNKEGLVELYQGQEKFADVAGLAGAKDLIKRLLTTNKFDANDPDVRAKGALFCGPPGTGKTLIAKAAGNEMNMPTLMVHPGNWMGSLVGESEAKTRKGFQIIRAHAPCIAVIDEIEKVMPRSRGGNHDGGVSARMEGSFLTALNDMVEPVFWCFTANDVETMHEAFFRAERVDAVFYVRLPSRDQRAAVWKLYLKKFFPAKIDDEVYPFALELNYKTVLKNFKVAKKPNRHEWANRLAAAFMTLTEVERKNAFKELEEDMSDLVKAAMVDDAGWTPAEIRACCRLSRRLEEPLSQTKNRIRPVSVSAHKAVRRLERWAEEAALDAETGAVYSPDEYADDDVMELLPPATSTKKASTGKVRRRVRTVKTDD